MNLIDAKMVGNFISLRALLTFWSTTALAILWHVWVSDKSGTHEIQLGFTSTGSNGSLYSTNSFPLSKSGYSFFTPGQNYSVEISLVIPDYPQNRALDFSLVKLHLHSREGGVSRTLVSSDSVTASGRLELETDGLRWYSAKLVINSVLHPALWHIYRNPILVAFVCVVSTTLTLNCLLVFKTLIRRISSAKKPKSQPTISKPAEKGEDEEKEGKHERKKK